MAISRKKNMQKQYSEPNIRQKSKFNSELKLPKIHERFQKSRNPKFRSVKNLRKSDISDHIQLHSMDLNSPGSNEILLEYYKELMSQQKSGHVISKPHKRTRNIESLELVSQPVKYYIKTNKNNAPILNAKISAPSME